MLRSLLTELGAENHGKYLCGQWLLQSQQQWVWHQKTNGQTIYRPITRYVLSISKELKINMEICETYF